MKCGNILKIEQYHAQTSTQDVQTKNTLSRKSLHFVFFMTNTLLLNVLKAFN